MKTKSDETQLSVKICPVCGKRYIKAPMSVYKIYNGKGYVSVCSWGCMRKHEKEIESLEKKRCYKCK